MSTLAPFNTTFDRWYGPASPFGPPGTLWDGPIPGRLVPQLHIFPGMFSQYQQTAWVTADGLLTVNQISVWDGAWTLTYNYAQADQLAIPSGTAPQWVVLDYAWIFLNSGYEYTRLLVAPRSNFPP